MSVILWGNVLFGTYVETVCVLSQRNVQPYIEVEANPDGIISCGREQISVSNYLTIIRRSVGNFS